ncbi:uncharacterized protein [Nicotiana tomentosiformis]|uniref:uncharacterized protein n=1 Tax=Nicotiana tomentosiformis TaxID=4098 RepID=UPI00388C5972
MVLRLQGHLCVPNVNGLRETNLVEAHNLRYSIHPGVTKMYRDLRQYYWCRRMKKDIVEYVARCLNCQQACFASQSIGSSSDFHVSMLWKYHADRSYVLDYSIVQLDESLGYKEEPVTIVDRQVRHLRSKKILVVKVQWRGKPVEESTWETEEDMQSRYPHLFSTPGMILDSFEDECLLKR